MTFCRYEHVVLLLHRELINQESEVNHHKNVCHMF